MRKQCRRLTVVFLLASVPGIAALVSGCHGNGNNEAPPPTNTVVSTNTSAPAATQTPTLAASTATPTNSRTNTSIPTTGAATATSTTSAETPSPTRTNTSSSQANTPTPTSTSTPTPTTISGRHFCDLPGSVRTTADGLVVVPGGPADAPDLSFLHLPVGFCAHFFAKVGNARKLVFAPSGELFVASPTTTTTGGNSAAGQAAIVILPDDDHDGIADAPITYLDGLPSTQGMLFANDHFYYQDDTKIMRVVYNEGDRTAPRPKEEVANITIYNSRLHWPKALDVADDGTIYVTNGGDQGEACDSNHPFHGGILKLDGSPGGTPVAKGFRNPISLRCSRGHNLCFAVELAKDFSTAQGGREKVVPVHQGDDWGFPCCASKDLPYSDVFPVPDCSRVAPEDASFIIAETPFDLDFETGKWPAPWNNRIYVPLHGAAGSWLGARLVSIALDPVTGRPTGAKVDFGTGWDDGTRTHGRPANVAFAADGRLFLGNDNNGVIIWIAPLDL